MSPLAVGLAAALRPLEDAPPLDPGQDEAREWVLQELAKPDYESARPQWWDELALRIQDWIMSLFRTDGGGSGTVMSWLALVLGALLVGGVLWLVLRNVGQISRSEVEAGGPGALFEDDSRTLAELRAAAEAAAARGDWPLAVAEQFRALARGLADRTILVLRPGSTAQDAGRLAGVAFPSRAAELARAADDFDRARYLELPVDEASWRAVRELDRGLESARPERRASLAELASARRGPR